MKASYNWLKEFVDFDMDPDELAHTLSVTGLEVEGIEKFDDDTILEIGITPNRPDCLSIRGIAREISAITENPVRDVTPEVTQEEGQGPSVDVLDSELCPRYSSRIITGVKIGQSPEWLSKRLESCGIRPTSNIVDITNYVLLELGQPMHAFDLDMLSGKKIVVKKAGDTKSFTTLDEEERQISTDSLLIWDAEKPVAIAGVMGGGNSEVSDSTVNILLESAYFNPSSVRRTSKQLGLSTESSYRFERGIDLEAVTFALDRAAQLVLEIAGGKVTATTDEYPLPYKKSKINISSAKLSSIIGVEISNEFIENTLLNLGCSVNKTGEGYTVIPPSFRNDIEREIDIVEEVARIYGYDNIPSTLPEMHMSPVPEHKIQELSRSLKQSMVKSGYLESVNYSFMNPDSLERLLLPDLDSRRNLIYVKNPLRKEDSAMRTSLVPALLDNVSLNLKRGEKMLRFFEVSSVFLNTGEKLPKEVKQIAAAFHKESISSLWQTRHEGFYDIKGVFENIFRDLKITSVSFQKNHDRIEPYLHPGKSCSIMIGDKVIGSAGQLHPNVASSYDIKGDITVAEIFDLNELIEASSSSSTYKSLPKYPYSERDTALVVAETISVAEVREIIMSIGSDLIESVNLFDVYKGKPIPSNKKSLAFSIRYRSLDKTLTDAEVDSLHNDIIKSLQDNIQAELR